VNTLIVNQWGGKLVTCEAHRAQQMQHFFGEHGPETSTEEGCPLCREARQIAEHPAKVRAALLDPKCSHTRFRPFGRGGYVTIYHRDDTSPTGVLAACSADEALFNSIYNELRQQGLSSSKSPLSPTEGR
jgi:hypothetical protein